MSPAPVGPDPQLVDAVALASNGATVLRGYSLVDLPRVAEAGAMEGTVADLTLHFSQVEGRVTIDGVLSGVAVLTCQRCMGLLEYAPDEPFSIAVVKDDDEAATLADCYEAVIADPSRLDLRWLAEEQMLLALPLVPKHPEIDGCVKQGTAISQPAMPSAVKNTDSADESRQRPFQNLRDLLRKSGPDSGE